MATYELRMRDNDGVDETRDIEAESLDLAIEQVQEEAEDWCSYGEWGDDGASIWVGYTLSLDGEEVDDGSVTVEIEPDHESLIQAAARHHRVENWCGDSPDDHNWTSEGEGGCDENPGVWSVGGTAMVFQSHCRRCGLHRTEHHTGSQRNPGEHDTTEYYILDEDEIEQHRKDGTMDVAEEASNG